MAASFGLITIANSDAGGHAYTGPTVRGYCRMLGEGGFDPARYCRHHREPLGAWLLVCRQCAVRSRLEGRREALGGGTKAALEDRKRRAHQLRPPHAMLLPRWQSPFARSTQHEQHHGFLRLTVEFVFAQAHREIQRDIVVIAPRSDDLAHSQFVECSPVSDGGVGVHQRALLPDKRARPSVCRGAQDINTESCRCSKPSRRLPSHRQQSSPRM